MADRVTLKVEPREATGKGAARSMRREGYVPGVIYGHGRETRECRVDTQQIEKVLTSISYENTIINLELDGDATPVLIREVQIHPYRPEVLHVDFLAVRKGEKIRVEVPIRLVGEAAGVEEGGIMEQPRHEVELRCDPDVIPEVLELDVSELQIGDSLTIGDLRVPPGIEILDEPERTICAVVPPTKIEEPEPEVVEAEELEAVAAEGEPSEEEEAAEAGAPEGGGEAPGAEEE